MRTGGIIFAAAFWHTTDDGELHCAAISMMSALPVLVHPDGTLCSPQGCDDQTVKRGHA